MNGLFEIPPCESPRLRWLKKHDVHTHHNKNVQPGDEDELSGETIYPWVAYKGLPNFPMPNAGYGNTEHEAIVDWAIKNNVRLWNEEAL